MHLEDVFSYNWLDDQLLFTPMFKHGLLLAYKLYSGIPPSRTLIRREPNVGPSNREIHPEHREKEDDPDDDYVYGER